MALYINNIELLVSGFLGTVNSKEKTFYWVDEMSVGDRFLLIMELFLAAWTLSQVQSFISILN